MQQEQIREYIFMNPRAIKSRVEYFRTEFVDFMLYYFPLEFMHDLAQFQVNYSYDLQNGEDVLFVGFRECAKSMILRYYYVWCICYRKKRFIMHYNDNHTKAKKMLLSVIIILEKNKKIIRDFGNLYIPAEGRKQRDPTKKSISEFITVNQVMMKAMSGGMSPRGESFYSNEGETIRPDLVGMDDIDTYDNTKNANIIEDSVDFILNEVLGGVDAFCQLILLGNVISEDGRVPRLKTHFMSDKENNMKIYWQKIREKGKIVWDRFVATDKQANEKNKNIENSKAKFISLQTKRRKQGSIAYNSNFNLVAYKKGQKILKKSDIYYYSALPKHYKNVMGIDPAFSTKTHTDNIGIAVTAQEKFKEDMYYYIREVLGLEGEEKDEDNFVKVVENLYKKYNITVIYIESNNGGEVLGRMLKKRGMSVVVFPTIKDKVTNMRENQSKFERGLAKWNPEEVRTGEAINEMLNFPNPGEKDDRVDAVLSSMKPAQGAIIRVM